MSISTRLPKTKKSPSPCRWKPWAKPRASRPTAACLSTCCSKSKLAGLAKDLPELITVDVSHLKIGQAIHLGEIKAPAGVELVGDKGIPVIAVAAPRTEEEEAAESGRSSSREPGRRRDDQREERRRRRALRRPKAQRKPGAKGAEKGPGCQTGARRPCPAPKRKRPRRREEGCSGRREEARSRLREEEEVTWVAARLWAGRRIGPAHGEPVSHRGIGQSRRGLRPNAAQCRFSGGGTFGGALAGRLVIRQEVQRADGARRTGLAQRDPVRAADVHELER